VDTDYITTVANSPIVEKEKTRIIKKTTGRKIIFSVDRLDYTKGVPERLLAFEKFLEKYPNWRGKVTFILLSAPSRVGITQYQFLKQKVDELIGKINGKYGVPGWIPIWYFYRSLPLQRLISFYQVADVALVTPLQDGMNLVAKEYLIARKDLSGVLILSKSAGASSELGEAFLVNPNNIEEVAETINQALMLSKEEQVTNNRTMRQRLLRYNVFRWAEDFIHRALEIKKYQTELLTRRLGPQLVAKMLNHYKESSHRFIFLDYDGTLVPFAQEPQFPKPDEELLQMLDKFSQLKENKVVIISGRNPEIMEKWLGNTNATLVAEHGAWIRESPATKWETTAENLSGEWKQKIRPLLEMFVDRTPGSLIEEKTFALAWHYRKAEADLGSLRARELMGVLGGLIANTKLQVLQGSKVVEVKLAGIDKGKAVEQLLSRSASRQEVDFILAIGDDWTDESIFKILPKEAWSIRVGSTPSSQARFYLESYQEVRTLLKKLMSK